jgi:cytochrome c peroxidase
LQDHLPLAGAARACVEDGVVTLNLGERVMNIEQLKRGSHAILLAGLLSGCGTNAEPATVDLGTTTSALTVADRLAACATDPRVELGFVSAEICAGADVFFRETFDGNGRQCGTCHRAEDNFTISPAFIASLPATDPLFVASNTPGLETLERPALLHDFAMVVENVDGVDDLANKFTMRSIPHTLSLATSLEPSPGDGSTTPPNQRTGWSGDGAPGDGTLRDFLSGAVFQHYPKDLSRTAGSSFRLPDNDELDVAEAFQMALGRTNELDITTLQLSDASAQEGIGLFLNNRCNNCHRNAGANRADALGVLTNRNFSTGVESTRIPAIDLAGIPHDGGFGQSNTSPFPGAFGDGKFNSPPLIEAADTGPFFHTNAFTTIEEAVGFYTTAAFASSPAGSPAIVLDTAQINKIGRFLRVLNIALNVQMAIQRLDAAIAILHSHGSSATGVENDLLELAAFELEDAIEVSSGAPTRVLTQQFQSKLETAYAKTLTARSLSANPARINNADVALNFANQVNGSLGSGLSFDLPAGNLMR